MKDRCIVNVNLSCKMEKNPRFDIDVIVLMLLCGALLFPVIPIGVMRFRVSDIVALTLVPMLALSFQRTVKSCGLFFLCIIVGAFVWSTLYSYLFLSVPMTIRDVNELSRVLILVFVYWITVNVEPRSSERAILLFFRIATPVIIVFSLVQYFFPHQIPARILDLYGGAHHVETLLTRSHPRIFATGADPNIGGAIILLFFFFHLSFYNERRRIASLAIALVFLVLLGFTASRTCLIALFLVMLLLVLFSGDVRPALKIFLLLLLPLCAYMAWISVDYIRLGFLAFMAGENVSWETRLQLFEDAKNLFLISPVFGWGPAKAIHTTIVDGEYFLLLRRYGIVGLMCVVAFMARTVFFIMKLNRDRTKVRINGTLKSTLLLYSFAMFVLMITNNFFSSYQLALPYMVLLAYVERAAIDNSRLGI